jgi:hypothetical protein
MYIPDPNRVDDPAKVRAFIHAHGFATLVTQKDGIPCASQGTLTFVDGRQYVGQFKYDTINGHGKMTYPDGRIEEGLWKDGKFMGASTAP